MILKFVFRRRCLRTGRDLPIAVRRGGNVASPTDPKEKMVAIFMTQGGWHSSTLGFPRIVSCKISDPD